MAPSVRNRSKPRRSDGSRQASRARRRWLDSRRADGTLAKRAASMPDRAHDRAKFVDLGLDSIVRRRGSASSTASTAVHRRDAVYSIRDRRALPHVAGAGRAANASTDARRGASPSRDAVNQRVPRGRRRPQRMAQSGLADACRPPAIRISRSGSKLRHRPPGDGPADAIAMIGMSGQFPRAQQSRRVLAQHRRGRDCITEVPPSRWDIARLRPRPAAAGKDQQQVDGRARGRRPVRSAVLQHLADRSGDAWIRSSGCSCRACWHGIEDAGYNPRSLSGQQVRRLRRLRRPATITCCRASSS